MQEIPLHQIAAERFGHQLRALVGRPLFWAIFVALGLTIPIVRTMLIDLPPPLPVVATVPDFRFTDQYGQEFSSEKLRGRVWVANFIFTRCPTICIQFTDKMYRIQHRGRGMGEGLRLVSFTVDPDFDTPDKLLAYAQANKASPRMWTFLTGEKDALAKTIVDGLKVHMTNDGSGDIMSIGHGGHFVLVDGEMRVRGYYDSSDDDAVDRVLRDVGLVANRGY